MQVTSNARKLSRVLIPPISLHPVRFLYPDARMTQLPHTSPQQSRNLTTTFSSPLAGSIGFSGTIYGARYWSMTSVDDLKYIGQPLMNMMTQRSCSATSTVEEGPTEVVKEFYDKMLNGVNARYRVDKVWLQEILKNCANHQDIELLFDILLKFRIFRMSSLRINTNYSDFLCLNVAKACARAGDMKFGMKILSRFNVYGLTPNIRSAHHLLFYAKKQKDFKLMVEILKIMQKNCLRVQASTADIVFSICYNTDKWNLIYKYFVKFKKSGVKLKRESFDKWMKFAALRGDNKTLWKLEKLRAQSVKKPSIGSALACAKGFLLERKPENAADIIQVLNQNFSDETRPCLMRQLQKMVSDWPLNFLKFQKEEDRKALAAALQTDIPVMISGLLSTGLVGSINVEDLSKIGESCLTFQAVES